MPASKPSLSTSRVIFYKHTLPTTKMSPYQLPIGHRSRAWDEHPPSPGHMTTKSASATGPGRGQTWPFSRLTGPLWPLRGSFAPAPRCARPTASESAHPSAREPAGGGPLRGLSSGPRVSAGVFPPPEQSSGPMPRPWFPGPPGDPRWPGAPVLSPWSELSTPAFSPQYLAAPLVSEESEGEKRCTLQVSRALLLQPP
jgi:hypothetical protein